MDIYASDPIRRTNPRSPVLRVPFIDDGIPVTTIIVSPSYPGGYGEEESYWNIPSHSYGEPSRYYSSNVFLRYHSYSSMPLRPLITPPTPP